ncbi:ion channel [Paenibacillus sambharensis]|nr:ion channel [Paenibacillus sambharensis]
MSVNNEIEQPSLIVLVWEAVLKFLGRISLFDLIMRYLIKDWSRQKKFAFVDSWVIGHTILSFLAVFVSFFSDVSCVKYALLFYGLLRVFEIFVYQTSVVFIHGYRSDSNVRSYRRSVICLIHNFFEIILWFTSSYIFLMDRFDVINSSGNLLQAFYISFVTMTTFGPPNFNVKGSPAMIVIVIQSIIGLFMTIISLAHFISLLPKPRTLDSHENQLIKNNDV